MSFVPARIDNAGASRGGLGRVVTEVLARGFAFFLGVFSLVNLLGSLRVPRFDATLWWIDLRAFPSVAAKGFLLLCAVFLLAYAARPPHSSWRRYVTFCCAALLAVKSLVDSMVFYQLLAQRSLSAAVPVPLSLFISAMLVTIVGVSLHKPRTNRRRELAAAFGVCLACAFAFPLGQMFCFGKTDYRRPADIAVVFGARVYASGQLSDALADRVSTACALYHQGLAAKLLFSGGPGDGAIHETEAMKRMAVDLGVREQDIFLDAAGLNTQATVKNSQAIFARLHASHVLAVSHFYHLPRIKMAYQRAGWDVFTVPAEESYLLRQMPYNMAREVAALWVYYFRPLTARQQAQL